MSFILYRTNGSTTEYYMNVFRIDKDGEWRKPFEKQGMNLPYEFDTLDKAMRKIQKCTVYEESGWTYHVSEYLR